MWLGCLLERVFFGFGDVLPSDIGRSRRIHLGIHEGSGEKACNAYPQPLGSHWGREYLTAVHVATGVLRAPVKHDEQKEEHHGRRVSSFVRG